MTRILTVLILSAAIATAAPWSIFKGKKGEKAKSAKAEGYNTIYTGGTIAIVPKNIPGKLNLSDRKNLHFHYGKPTLTVPYARITGIEVADTQKESLLSFPGLNKKKRVVIVGWEDERGTKNNARFELGINESVEVLPLLEERAGREVTIAGMSDAEGWWGDKAWKTSSNAHKWESQQQKPTLAAAKEE